MKFRIPNKLTHNLPTIARKSGYIRIFNYETKKESFARKITKYRYPRFHLYLDSNNKEIIFDLHLDQTKTIYNKQIAHGADYEGEKVRNELARIFDIVSQFVQK